jgi:hypothetical protein
MINIIQKRYFLNYTTSVYLIFLLYTLSIITYLPSMQKAVAAQDTVSQTQINLTAVVKNGTQSIMKDLNATREAILSGDKAGALKKIEDAYQSTGVLSTCATSTSSIHSTPSK